MGSTIFVLVIAIGIPIWILIWMLKVIHNQRIQWEERRKELRERNFFWYSALHPECTSGKRVLCNVCKSDSVRIRGLMQGTYTREHFCGRCGETLYYSPEGAK